MMVNPSVRRLRIKKTDGTRLVLAVNLNPEPILRLSLRIPKGRTVEVLSANGDWKRVEGRREGAFMLLPIPVGFYETVVVRLLGINSDCKKKI